MTEAYLLTVFATVLSGTLVFVIGQVFQGYVLKPLSNFSKIKSEVHFNLEFYFQALANTTIGPEVGEGVSDKIKSLAIDVEVNYFQIPFASLLGRRHFFNLPSREDIGDTVGTLLFLSSSVGGGESNKHLHKAKINIYRGLRMKHLALLTVSVN